jgi:hypothetical protein
MRTASERRMNVPPLPHAAILTSAIDIAQSIQVSLSGPTGAVCDRNARGSVDRSANKLTIRSRPASRCFANPMHRLIVRSSRLASAVDGFKPMKATTRSESPTQVFELACSPAVGLISTGLEASPGLCMLRPTSQSVGSTDTF